ncbi:hypothetical protein NOVOSPHI9U_580028 [Novosphingobium sp. 9U]|nr:hypothetical protein NOVOSPHI9U_580028 [Novosphingobium sp. 9U]
MMAFGPADQTQQTGMRPHGDQIAGSVERVTFHNADTGFCVLRLKVRGQRDLVTLIGHDAAPAARKRSRRGWLQAQRA